MASSEIREWLDSHVNLERMAGVASGSKRRLAPEPLSRMEALVELLGSPQLQYPVIHVTGTNGKTTVARMITALLVADGLSVGTDTSPYLERFNERMSWNGEPVPDDELDRLLERVADLEHLLPDRPSYFEIIHGAALEWFADVAVEVAVIEVGLGGRWDATNVVDGRVAVVTNVELDHVEYLGPTRADIAREKAGIVKPGAALVLGETDPELIPIFSDREGVESVVLRDRDFGVEGNRLAVGGRVVDLFTPWSSVRDAFLPLHGAHQGDNAAIALAAAEAFLGRGLDASVVQDAFATVSSPGRLEVVARDPLVVLDGTKNVAGAHAVRAALDEEFPPRGDGTTRTWVVGILRQKDPVEMLDALGVRDGDRVIATRPEIPRAREPREVADAARELGVAPEHIEVVDRVRDAVQRAIDTSDEGDQVVVAGSLYVAGPARSALVR